MSLNSYLWARHLKLGNSTFELLTEGERFRFGRGRPTSPVYIKTSRLGWYRRPGEDRRFRTSPGAAVWRDDGSW